MKKKVVDEEQECLKLEKMKNMKPRGVFDSEGVYSVPNIVVPMLDSVFGSRVWMYSVPLKEFAWKLHRYGAILFDEGGGCKVGGVRRFGR
ncbi:hypothetical protein LR48_Vigan03g076400 [Vigna angularis]|uniref:Uncharacterized protein n=1 Tax=Phaseolus angularis TaxID=3914 RepID=A0A0L9U3W6_PHAAN|nr:hypothetical protein LR48_Vigan03g076400 [Vigna angularis]